MIGFAKGWLVAVLTAYALISLFGVTGVVVSLSLAGYCAWRVIRH
jgi:hypothetical protein